MTRRKAVAKPRARLGAWGAAGLVTVAPAAMLSGGDRVAHAVESLDGSAWLWSRTAGEVGLLDEVLAETPVPGPHENRR